MAGSYPDVPGRRMAWDSDGTVGFYGSTTFAGPVVEFNGAQKTALNGENPAEETGSLGSTERHLYVLFPELREVDGFFGRVEGQADRIGALHTSGDTTNGYDGTWTQRSSNVPDTILSSLTAYRLEILSLAVSNVRSIRVFYIRNTFGSNLNASKYHVYGEIAAGETPDRLLWVDNSTGAEFGLPIDYGDIPRGSAEDREVKLRNNSASMTAASVQVTAESLFRNSGNWYTFKEAGGSFQSTLPLSSSIGAGSDSPVLTVRRNTPDSGTLGLHAGRTYANVGSWS